MPPNIAGCGDIPEISTKIHLALRELGITLTISTSVAPLSLHP